MALGRLSRGSGGSSSVSVTSSNDGPTDRHTDDINPGPSGGVNTGITRASPSGGGNSTVDDPVQTVTEANQQQETINQATGDMPMYPNSMPQPNVPDVQLSGLSGTAVMIALALGAVAFVAGLFGGS